MAITITGRDVQQIVWSKGNELANRRRLPRYGSTARSMQQVTSIYAGIQPLEYIFLYVPQSFTHEGYGINLNQIPRPYLSPIVDITSGNARKAGFEFTIVQAEDSFFNAVDDEIQVVQTFADNGIPVNFNGVHKQLNELSWYIESATFTHNRSNLSGSTTAATCTLSLTEFTVNNKKLILLPRFRYGKIDAKTKKDATADGTMPDFQADADRLINTTLRFRTETPVGNVYGGMPGNP